MALLSLIKLPYKLPALKCLNGRLIKKFLNSKHLLPTLKCSRLAEFAKFKVYISQALRRVTEKFGLAGNDLFVLVWNSSLDSSLARASHLKEFEKNFSSHKNLQKISRILHC